MALLCSPLRSRVYIKYLSPPDFLGPLSSTCGRFLVGAASSCINSHGYKSRCAWGPSRAFLGPHARKVPPHLSAWLHLSKRNMILGYLFCSQTPSSLDVLTPQEYGQILKAPKNFLLLLLGSFSSVRSTGSLTSFTVQPWFA